jgi:hypothetical protein
MTITANLIERCDTNTDSESCGTDTPVPTFSEFVRFACAELLSRRSLSMLPAIPIGTIVGLGISDQTSLLAAIPDVVTAFITLRLFCVPFGESILQRSIDEWRGRASAKPAHPSEKPANSNMCSAGAQL